MSANEVKHSWEAYLRPCWGSSLISLLSLFGLVSNGGQFMFIKLMNQMGLQYSLSDEFSLYRQRNELWDVLKILKRLGEIES
jgi:hypothetical protein